MLTELLNRYRTRNYFDPSGKDFVDREDLIKILTGKAKSKKLKDSVYFIVCQNEIDQLSRNGTIRVDDLTDATESVFNKSEWFGKFIIEGQTQIIVPKRYDLLINHSKGQIFLTATERAKYYGSGNLQLDKDLTVKVLRTDIKFEELRKLVNRYCSNYQYAHSLKSWNL